MRVPLCSRGVTLIVSLVALLAVSCGDDGLGSRSPTAPPAPPTPAPTPAPVSTGYYGAVQILGAEPSGDCVATALYRDAPSTFDLLLGLDLSPDGTWTATFYQSEFLGVIGWDCSATVVERKKGHLTLELYPYCDFSYADWPFVEGCGPSDTTLVARELRIPVPSGDSPSTIRGEGAIKIVRYPESLPPLEIRAAFDLRDRRQ